MGLICTAVFLEFIYLHIVSVVVFDTITARINENIQGKITNDDGCLSVVYFEENLGAVE